jgi:hypothetical protein
MINEDLHDMQSGRQFPEFTLRRTIPWMHKVNIGRTTIDGKSVEFLGLGSHIIHAIDGDDFFGAVAAAFD